MHTNRNASRMNVTDATTQTRKNITRVLPSLVPGRPRSELFAMTLCFTLALLASSAWRALPSDPNPRAHAGTTIQSAASRSATAVTHPTRRTRSRSTTPHAPAHAAAPSGADTNTNSSISTLSRFEKLRNERKTKYPDAPHQAAPLFQEPPQTIGTPDPHMAVYLTASSVKRREFVLDTIEALKRVGGNALVFDVKGSAVYFDIPGDSMARELNLIRPQYDLEEILNLAHEQGLYTIARYIAVKDGGLSNARPDTVIRHPVSGKMIGTEWVDPENPDVHAYNYPIICTLAAAGINEINLDYIRFSTGQFGELMAYSGKEKAVKVRSFVQMARNAIDTCGPQTKLGLSTYAILGWNYKVNLETLGQDVVDFAPLVDIISPMAYPATFSVHAYYNPEKNPGSRMYYLVYRTLTGYQDLLGSEHAWKLRPWIQGYGTTGKDMLDQMTAVSDAGLCGFSVWSAGNYYDATYKGLASWTQPEHCKAGSPVSITESVGKAL